ncbi:MAG: hypothetical protein EZS28_031202 [Streblomastix strix]|uniref:Uncharacterized protein n=1 Tax=Streblomastix strix TaxID=222440 RepID=A0A5J4USZ6_9EUKA|nr:MAG: hypothetical protein EZS28_031202 [Streblomastix strix]
MLQINNDLMSFYTGRQQNASTTVEVTIWREKALNSKTEAPLALNFVIVAWRINSPLQGDQIPIYRMMVVNIQIRQLEEGIVCFLKSQNNDSS